METGPIIRPDIGAHMASLRRWLHETEHVPLEEMRAFFGARIDGYEAHMSLWGEAYRRMAELLPGDAHTLLDLGAGTGLELDAIFRTRTDLSITCIDLSRDMLSRLVDKHPGVHAIEGDYCAVPLPMDAFDAVIAVETLHHLGPAQKLPLYRRVWDALRPGGTLLVADYIACCDEEEALLTEACRARRKRQGIPDDVFVHFDTPLTLAHEIALLAQAGFGEVEAPCAIEGACFLRAVKPVGKQRWL